ncbi:MAG TPA: ABC transporter ATP-binding protein [Gaiellaceae bacterium]|nr:ABC transporter ATP-binding protein [Gaiellaceae bacterium]
MAEPIVEAHGEGAVAPSPAERGSGLELRNLTKHFSGHQGERVVAVDDVNLTIEHGEYVVLLGPSGCGKTTTLRMIGGHEEPSSGEMLLDGQSLLGLPPEKRPTTTVFQHFALFPHKNVLHNVEFGPKMHGVGKEERRRKAQEALEMVGLTEFADRKPAALSGGQQQRVALARVLVMEPKALLLDEPLGDLDRLLRLRMRVELRNLQRQLGLMFIHVTHDQEEALSVADRIVVMHEGRIAQVGDPFTISTRPENEIVARFMGDNNIFRGNVGREGDRLVIDAGRLKVATTAVAGFEPGSEAAASIRAAAVRVDEEPRSVDGVNQLECQVEFVEYLGDLVKLHLRLDDDVFVAKVPGDEYALLRGREGATVRISWQEADVQLLRP